MHHCGAKRNCLNVPVESSFSTEKELLNPLIFVWNASTGVKTQNHRNIDSFTFFLGLQWSIPGLLSDLLWSTSSLAHRFRGNIKGTSIHHIHTNVVIICYNFFKIHQIGDQNLCNALPCKFKWILPHFWVIDQRDRVFQNRILPHGSLKLNKCIISYSDLHNLMRG
jgi:hypothetical protein